MEDRAKRLAEPASRGIRRCDFYGDRPWKSGDPPQNWQCIRGRFSKSPGPVEGPWGLNTANTPLVEDLGAGVKHRFEKASWEPLGGWGLRELS